MGHPVKEGPLDTLVGLQLTLGAVGLQFLDSGYTLQGALHHCAAGRE